VKIGKAEAERGIKQMVTLWRKLPEQAGTPSDQLSSIAFFYWVQSEYPNYLQYRSTYGVRHDVEEWFEREIKSMGKR